MGKEEKKRFGQLDKPCIFTIQGSYRGVPWRQTGVVWGEKEEGEPRLYVHLFLGAWVVRGGVTGRPEFTPPYWYLAFFSEGFRIFKTQTQRNVSLSVHTHTHTQTPKKGKWFSHYLEGAHEGFINTHHTACIIKLPAVVWSREKCDQLAFGKELVSILHNLLKERWHYSSAYKKINTKKQAFS